MNDRQATVHGVYDVWLGGVQHFRADRELAAAIEERFPAVPAHVRAAQDFHLRAARWCAERGIARFIATGTAAWKPGARNVHDVARQADPGAGVVYVHRGREAHDWARVLLAGPGLHCARAEDDDPAGVLAAIPVKAMLAEDEPVCLILGMTLHFSPPKEAAGQVAAYAAALPTGSALVASVSLIDGSPRAAELLAMFTPATAHRHAAADVAGWMTAAGLELAQPVGDVRRLLPGGVWASGEQPPRAPGMTAGVLGLVR